MPYILTKSNGRVFATIADGSIDQTTALTFLGKNYAGYGQSIGENFLYLLENFANITAPTNPLQGQIWYDTSVNKIKVYNGSAFRTMSFTDIANTPPAEAQAGDFWFNTSNNQLSIKVGSTFTTVSGVAGGSSLGSLTTVKDNSNNSRTVLKITVNNQDVAVFSYEAFTVNISEAGFYSKFPKVVKGLTLIDTNASGKSPSTDTYMWGTASAAAQARTMEINTTTSVAIGEASTGTYANSVVVRDNTGTIWATSFFNSAGPITNGFAGSAGFFGSRGFAGSAGTNGTNGTTGFFGSRGFTGSTGVGSGTDILPTNNEWSGSNRFAGLTTSTNVDINGGTIDGTTIGASSPTTGVFTQIVGQVATSSQTSGALTTLSANRQVFATGSITISGGTFTAGDIIIVDGNGADRTIIASGVTMHYNGVGVGSVTLNGNGVAGIKFRSTTICVVTGNVT